MPGPPLSSISRCISLTVFSSCEIRSFASASACSRARRSSSSTRTRSALLRGLPLPDAPVIPIKSPFCREIEKNRIRSYWPLISYVRQQPFFIYDTIKKNITLEEDQHKNDDLTYSLEVSGLDELIESFPERLDKIITENGKNISGGQQQRIAIARAVYKNADLLILDEPFNELDEAAELKILGHFIDMAKKGKIVILVTHNRKILSHCTKIISLDEQG